jgi:hypothetical protein
VISLGHLDTATFGDQWARFQAVAAIQYAYEQQLTGSRDWVNILTSLGATGSCPTCVTLDVPPCHEVACKLAGSTAAVKLAGTPSIVVPLTGSSVLKVCDAEQLVSNTTGGLFVMGSPGKVLRPAPVGALATACTRTISAEGLIQCGAAPKKISYEVCTDHSPAGPNNAGTTASGACTGTACAASTTNGAAEVVDPGEPLDELIGGPCTTISSTAGVAGDAFVNLTSQIGLAPPGDDCTDPSTYTSAGTAQLTALTTGSATATVMNADGAAGTSVVSDPGNDGTPYDCALLKFGESPGLKLVGSFPAINTLSPAPGVFLDSTTSFTLQCES